MTDGQEPRSVRIAWHRRLGVKLAVILALTLAAFDMGSASLSEWVFDSMGIPDEVYVLENAWLVPDFLQGAEPLGPGRWQPTDAVLMRQQTAVSFAGVAFLWLDTEGGVVYPSPVLPWTPGDHFALSGQTVQDLALPDGRTTRATVERLQAVDPEEGDVLAGTFVSVLSDRAVHAAFHGVNTGDLDELYECDFSRFDEHLLVDSVAFEAQSRELMRLANQVYYGLLALVVVGLSAGISSLVTRRLRKLVVAASAPIGDGGLLPGPFPATKRDEIGALARALNGLRDRVAGLLGRMAERDEHRREWVAQVSHDLRTPLTALMACLDRADQALDGDDPDAVRRDVSRMLKTARLDANRVCILAEDLLDIARLDADDPLDREPVPPGELVRSAAHELVALAELRGLELEAEVAPNLPTPMADGRRLMRAVENLLRNALEHAESRVVVAVAQDGDALRFEVRDDGPGLPEGEDGIDLLSLSRLRSRADSTGLGLVVTQRVAEAHGGVVGAANRPGGGASVWFTVPVTAPLASRPRPTPRVCPSK